jgi:multicomponent Na+:H+ antiporter subunit B
MSATLIFDLVLLALLLITAVATVEVRNLFGATMLAGIYSLLIAAFWTTTDAVDVAYTEAAVGAGISTILLIGTLVLTGPRETVRKVVHWPALLVCAAVGALLIYGTLDMPAFGQADAPAHTHPMYKQFTTQTVKKSPDGKSAADVAAYEAGHEGAHEHEDFFHGHVPNQVTSVIVTYRAFDTMFETAVIFTAGMGMIVLLRGRKRTLLHGRLL